VRTRDPIQEAQRAYNRRQFDRQQCREGRADWALMLAALVFVLTMLAGVWP